MKCFHCGKTVPDDARFCKYCGTRLRRTCSICGAALDDDARFCAACGAEAVAELDLAKPVPELTAADWASFSTSLTNPLGFYFSRRISRQNRSASDNCVDCFENVLIFMESQKINWLRIDKKETILRRIDVSLDSEIKALSLRQDGILAAGFDWRSGGDPVVMLWEYDNANNLRTAKEVLMTGGGAERRTYKMRFTDSSLFVFSWDLHDKGKREIVKYDLHSGRLEQKQIGGKRIDLWYAAEEKVFYRCEREDECYFGVLDTGKEPWTARKLWNIGAGSDEIPDAPVYCDFAKGIAWTPATPNECRQLNLLDDCYIARELAPGHKAVAGVPAWHAPEAGAVNYFLDYFDGEKSYKASTVLAMDACERDGSKHRWKYALQGDTENVIVWDKVLLGDFTGLGYRIYPATMDGPADIYRDGLVVNEL